MTQRKTLAEQAEHQAEANPTFNLDEAEVTPYQSNRATRHKERDKRLAKEQAEREAFEAKLAEDAAERVQARKQARAEATAEVAG